MAINLKNLQSKTVSEVTKDSSNAYIYVLNTATNVGSKVLLSDVTKEQAPITVGSGASMFKSMGVSGLKMNLRSLSSNSSFLKITQNSETIDFNISATLLDLSLCNNITSAFLSSVDLTTNVGTTILPVANGGTGVATLTDGGILLGSGTDTITAMDALAAGTIIYGDGTTDPSTLAIGTAAKVLTVNAGATAPEWATAVNTWNGTATSDLDMANYDIDLGTGWLSGDGTHEGINIDSNGKVFIGAGTPTAAFTSDVNLMGAAITLHSPASGNDVALDYKNTASGAGDNAYIYGSNAGGAGSAGGPLTVKPGDGNGAGDGGSLLLYGGAGGASGDRGNIVLYSTVGSTLIPTITLRGSTSRVSIQSGGATAVTPDGTLEINQQLVTGAIPCLVLDQDDVDYAFLRLDGSAGSGTAYNLDTEPAGDTSSATVAAPHSAAWVVVGMTKILVGTDVRYIPYYSKV